MNRYHTIRTIEKNICSKESYMQAVGSLVTTLSCGNESDIDIAYLTNDDTFWDHFSKNEEYRMYFLYIYLLLKKNLFFFI